MTAYGVSELLREFSEALLDELDYTTEGRNADRLRTLVDARGPGDQDVLIPRVHWELTTRRVITLEEIDGTKLSEREQLEAKGHDLASVAERVVRVYLSMVFLHGVFHADPHPANVLVCDAKIGLVDFGVVGYLSPRVKDSLGDLLFALVQQDAEGIVQVIVRMGAAGSVVGRDALRGDIQRMLVRYYSVSLESVPIARFLGEVMSVAFRHHVRLPTDLALLARTVVVLEGVARSLDPSFVLASYLEPFVLQLIKQRISLKRTVIDAITTLRELEDVARVLPRRVDVLSEQLEKGEMTVGIDVRHLDHALRKLDAIANRVAFSVIVAAVIVGSALILLGGEDAATFRIPFTGIGLPIPQIGFIVAGLLGGWLLFSIIRSRGL